MHKNHNKQPKKDVLSKLLSSKRASREINLPEDFHLSVMENLSGRLDGIGDMEPVFYFQKRDLAAGTVAARSIEAECREIYAVGGDICVCVTVISPTITAGICICAFVKGSCCWPVAPKTARTVIMAF